MRWTVALATAVLTLATARPSLAQDVHLLLITGVSGDDALAVQYHKWATGVIDAAGKRGLPAANITYLAESIDRDPWRIRARSTKENVEKAFADLAVHARPGDTVFVLLIGHGSFDGRTGAFNLPGPDLTVEDYARLLRPLSAEQVVFVNTASASGAFVQSLAAPGRIIVSATKTGGERNDTRFPAYFVEALESDAADRDRNGRVSVLEAFDYAAAKVKAQYEQEGHILTEHATLEDGSQGRLAGAAYLTPDRSRILAAAGADPALRALVEQREALERQVAALRLRKDATEPAKYEQELERLLTDLALKTQEIRTLEKGK
jgi:hypothetical protein